MLRGVPSLTCGLKYQVYAVYSHLPSIYWASRLERSVRRLRTREQRHISRGLDETALTWTFVPIHASRILTSPCWLAGVCMVSMQECTSVCDWLCTYFVPIYPYPSMPILMVSEMAVQQQQRRRRGSHWTPSPRTSMNRGPASSPCRCLMNVGTRQTGQTISGHAGYGRVSQGTAQHSKQGTHKAYKPRTAYVARLRCRDGTADERVECRHKAWAPRAGRGW